MSVGAPDRLSRIQRDRMVERLVSAKVDRGPVDINLIETKDCPFLAGYSKDGENIYIDRHLAKAAPMIDGVPYSKWKWALVRHETSEKVQIDRGVHYMTAHLLYATPDEHLELRRMRIDPGLYEKTLRPFIKAIEHERIENPPLDLDCTPMKGNDEMSRRILARLKKLGVKDAQS
jgi:hypothetical protein